MRRLELLGWVLVLATALLVFRNPNVQGRSWSYPYFSGAAHLDTDLTWRFSAEGYERIRSLPDTALRRVDFDAERAVGLREYKANSVGYVYIIWLAKELFPWLSYVNAVILLQAIFHIVSTAALGLQLDRPLQRRLFLFGYGANPLVIWVVTFPFYYYWQVLASIGFILLLRPEKLRVPAVIAIYAGLLLAFVTRPSLLFLIGCAGAVAVLRSPSRLRPTYITAGAGLLAAMLLLREPREPWHTMYVGLGAYPNAHVPTLSDDAGYRFFTSRTGTVIETHPSSGNYYDPALRADYMRTLREEYLRIVRSEPWLPVKATVLNVLGSFSVGYFTASPLLTMASVLAGGAVFVLLIVTGNTIIAVGVLASAAGFAWFFPPIPMYMFGHYSLLAFGVIRALTNTWPFALSGARLRGPRRSGVEVDQRTAQTTRGLL